MEEGGSIAQREKANQQFPVTIGAIAGKAPDVEDSFLVQDMTADDNKEQAAPHGEGATRELPEAARGAAESAQSATDSLSSKAQSAKESLTPDSVKEDKDCSVKQGVDKVKESSQANYKS